MICIDGMPQAKGVSEKGRSKQDWFVMEGQKRPDPGTYVDAAQKAVDSESPIPKAA
jgi:hypothetical protein